MKYKCIVFDMDGTILDTLEDLTDATNYALRMHGYPEHTIDEVRFFVGNGLAKLVRRAVPADCTDDECANVLQTLKSYYSVHSADKTKPYDGILELLKTLKEQGYQTAVVSNKVDAAVQDLCKVYYPGLFDVAVGERENVARKPAADMVQIALNALNVQEKDAVYIGDSDVDVATAKNAGLDGIFVEWGFRDKAFLLEHGAKCIIKQPLELLQYL